MSAVALRAIRARIETGWSQEAHARDASGDQVPLGRDDAVAWTLCGAFALASKGRHSNGHLPAGLRARSPRSPRWSRSTDGTMKRLAQRKRFSTPWTRPLCAPKAA